MAKRTNPKLVGAFVVGAVALAVTAIVMLGSGGFFNTAHRDVLFFQGNVNGLQVGAPVKLKGVEIGQVTGILLNLNLPTGAKAITSAADIKIPVLIQLNEKKFLRHGAGQLDLSNPEVLKEMIGMGLRGQLNSQSFVTGLLYVDLDFHPGTPENFYLPPGSDYQEIPTLPNALEQAQSIASRIVTQLNQIDFARLAREASETLAAIRKVVTSPELQTAVANLGKTEQSLNRTAISIQVLADNVNHQIGPLDASVRASTESANVTLQEARATLEVVRSTLAPDSPLIYQTNKTLTDLSSAANSMRQLTDFLQRDPSALIRGRDYNQAAP